MEKETKTHWKSMLTNLDYIGAYALNYGEDLTVKITSVSKEKVKGDKGKEEVCTVAHLEGQKPFILNRTNSKMIQRLYKSPYVEDWIGKEITLYATVTKVAGELVECLRIRNEVPSKEVKDRRLDISNERLEAALDNILQKKYTYEKLVKTFKLTENQRLAAESKLNKQS